MPTFSSSYLVPAIFLNPPFILHLINTFFSHLLPPPLPAISESPHRSVESLGPIPGSTPYLDMHADDQLCWKYTAIMVVAQLLVFGTVQDNRVRRKSAKAARLEREKFNREKKEERVRAMVSKANTHVIGLDGTCSHPEEHDLTGCVIGKAYQNSSLGMVKIIMQSIDDSEDGEDMSTGEGSMEEGSTGEGSMTETSEEELFSS